MDPQTKIPVTIIGGYLGSGKTTLVNHLLRNAEGRRLAIMVNEFGELPIDEDLIEARDDDIISLSGGCVCCSYGNDLVMAMMDMAKMDPRPDHVLLEASGVALPGSILNSLSLLAGYSMDGIIVLADAETVEQRSRDKYMADTVLRQLIDADIVLLNKTDLVSADGLEKTQAWLGERAPNAKIVATSRADIPPGVVLQQFERVDVEQPGHHAINGFSTRQIQVGERTNPIEFAQMLIDETPGLVRAKGFVRDLDDEMKTIQIVGRRFEVSQAPARSSQGMVVICVDGATT